MADHAVPGAPLHDGDVEVPGTAASTAVFPPKAESFAGIENSPTAPRMPPRSNSAQGLPALTNSPPHHSRGGSMTNLRSSAFRERELKVRSM
jgi:hypothetical protein